MKTVLIGIILSVVLSSPASSAVTVAITTPEQDTQFSAGAAITITAVASTTTGSIARVEFYRDAQLLATDTTEPFSTTLVSAPAGNYHFTAKAYDSAGASASSPMVAVVSRTARKYPTTTFDYGEVSSTGQNMQVRITLPTDVKIVRGIFVNGNGSGGDTRTLATQPEFYEFLRLHNLAYIGMVKFPSASTPSPIADGQNAFAHSLASFAEQSGHKELLHAPLVASGHSAGGAFSYALLDTYASRMIAFNSASGGYGNPPRALPAAALDSIGSNMGAENDVVRLFPAMSGIFEVNRAKGAKWSYLILQGTDHVTEDGVYQMFSTYSLDHAIRARYPAKASPENGPVNLISIPEAGGWLADNHSWKGGLTKISAYDSYSGDKRAASWLLDKDVAYVYRALSTYDRKIKVTFPKSKPIQAYDRGSDVMIEVDVSQLPNWRRMDFYDGSNLLGTVTNPAPPQFLATNLQTGAHAFSAIATDGTDVPKTSQPVFLMTRLLGVPGR